MRRLIPPLLITILAFFILSCSYLDFFSQDDGDTDKKQDTKKEEAYKDKLKELLKGDPFVYVSTNNGQGSIAIVDSDLDAKTENISIGDKVNDVTMKPDGTEAYVCTSESDKIFIIDLKTKQVTDTLELKDNPMKVAFHPNGSKAYATHSYSNYISIIDTEKKEVEKTVQVGKYPVPIAVSFDGSKAYVGHSMKFEMGETQKMTLPDGSEIEVPIGIPTVELGDKHISVIDLKTEKVIANIPVSGFCAGVAVTPDGKRVYATTSSVDVTGLMSGQEPDPNAKDTVSVIDTASNTIEKEISFDTGTGPSALAVTPDGKEVYTICGTSDSSYVIDTLKNEIKATIPLDIGG